jgi:hypothetical protein
MSNHNQRSLMTDEERDIAAESKFTAAAIFLVWIMGEPLEYEEDANTGEITIHWLDFALCLFEDAVGLLTRDDAPEPAAEIIEYCTREQIWPYQTGQSPE